MLEKKNGEGEETKRKRALGRTSEGNGGRREGLGKKREQKVEIGRFRANERGKGGRENKARRILDLASAVTPHTTTSSL